MSGEVAEEKLVRLKSISWLLNLAQYNKTEEVLAVPEPPMSNAELEH